MFAQTRTPLRIFLRVGEPSSSSLGAAENMKHFRLTGRWASWGRGVGGSTNRIDIKLRVIKWRWSFQPKIAALLTGILAIEALYDKQTRWKSLRVFDQDGVWTTAASPNEITRRTTVGKVNIVDVEYKLHNASYQGTCADWRNDKDTRGWSAPWMRARTRWWRVTAAKPCRNIGAVHKFRHAWLGGG